MDKINMIKYFQQAHHPDQLHIGNEPQKLPDLKVLSDAARDLNVARKNLLIYPDDHEQVKISLDRVMHSLKAVLDITPALTLTVIKDTLMVGTVILDSKIAVFKELAQSLRQFEIAAVTLRHGIDQQELMRFLKVITANPDMIRAHGGIEAVSMESELLHINIQAIDYSQLHLTEEHEIKRSGNGESPESLWQYFVSHLVSDTLARNKAGVDSHTDSISDPQQLAAELNQELIDPFKVMDNYSKSLSAYFMHSTEGLEGEQLNTAAPLNQFQSMIKALNPDLQQQFLGITFDHCSRKDTSPVTEQLVKSLGSDLVLGMLQHANDLGKQISPSLMAFIKKIIHIPRFEEQSRTDDQAATIGPVLDKMLSSKKMQALLSREKYEDYVDSEYSDMLDELTDSSPGRGNTSRLSSQLEQDLDTEQVYSHTALALLGLMTGSRNATEYKNWARQLALILDDLAYEGVFDVLLQIFTFIDNEHRDQNNADRSKIAGLVFKRFSDPQFLAKAITALGRNQEITESQGFELLTRIGEPVISEILDVVGAHERPIERSPFRSLLDSFGTEVAEEALERIEDPRPQFVLNMIKLIHRLGNSEIADKIKPLMEHQNIDIRLETIATLLRFKNPSALIHFREILAASWSPAVLQAIRIVGFYQVQEAVSLLIDALEKSSSVKTDTERREAIVKALGRIGDPRAIPLLIKLARKRWPLSQRHLRHLKRIIFENLDGYPYKSIKKLLAIGLKYKDEGIQSLCRRLMKKHHVRVVR